MADTEQIPASDKTISSHDSTCLEDLDGDNQSAVSSQTSMTLPDMASDTDPELDPEPANEADAKSEPEVDPETIYLKLWCGHYGLDDVTFRYLDEQDIIDSRDIRCLTPIIISNMDLTAQQRALLRGAVLQYFQNWRLLDRQINLEIKRMSSKQNEEDQPEEEGKDSEKSNEGDPPPKEDQLTKLEEQVKALEVRFNSLSGLRRYERTYARELHQRAKKKRKCSDSMTVAQRILTTRKSNVSQTEVDTQPSGKLEAQKDSSADKDPIKDKNKGEKKTTELEDKKEKDTTKVTEVRPKKKTEAELNNERLDKMIDEDFEEELDKCLEEKD